MSDAHWQPLFRGVGSFVATTGHFPSEHSARWWFRIHCAEAIGAGALIKHRGLWLADRDRLEQLIEVVGRRAALRSLVEDEAHRNKPGNR
jgi:hypothetical protein